MELELRERGFEEVKIYFERSADPEICRMLPRSVTTLEQAVENWRLACQPGADSFGRTIWVDGRYVGDIWCYSIRPGSSPEGMLSYCIFDKTLWGRGIATRAAAAFLLEIKARFGLKTIGAFCYQENRASLCVLKKTGFVCRESFTEDGVASCYLERVL